MGEAQAEAEREKRRSLFSQMTAPTIAVEDVDVEPEDSRVEAAGSEALTKEPPEVEGGSKRATGRAT